LHKSVVQRPGVAAGGIFNNVQPGTIADWKYFVEVKNYYSALLVKPDPKYSDANCWCFQRLAPLAAIFLLGEVLW